MIKPLDLAVIGYERREGRHGTRIADPAQGLDDRREHNHVQGLQERFDELRLSQLAGGLCGAVHHPTIRVIEKRDDETCRLRIRTRASARAAVALVDGDG